MDGGNSSYEFTALFMFSGIGAGAMGFLDAQVSMQGRKARFRSLGGIDNDRIACKDFERLTGSPSHCVDVATMTAQDLRDFAGEKAPDVVFMSPPCLPGHGEVLTPSGPRRIDSMRANDLVLTHAGRYRRVLKVGTHEYMGGMFGLRLNGTVDTQEFTAEHPIWVRRVVRNVGSGKRRTLGPPKFVPASEVRVGDRVGFPVQPEVPGTARAFVDSLGDPAVVERGGQHEGERYAKPRHEVRSPNVVDLRVHASHASLWFLLGAYLGDGYRRTDRSEVTFCVGARDSELAFHVRSTLRDLDLGHSEDASAGESNIKLRVQARHLWLLAGLFGDGAAEKFIPEPLMGLERGLLDALVNGYRMTDGSESPRRTTPRGQELQARWRIASVSLPLLRGLQRLLLRRGEYGSIHVAWPGGPQTIEGRAVETRPRWELSVRLDAKKRTAHAFDDGAVWIRVRDVVTSHRTERVWNLEVDEDNTFCAPLIATHNCKGFSGLMSPTKAATPKYQAMNQLAVRAVDLLLEAWGDDGPSLILLENVPRIATRGADLVKAVRQRLRKRRYVTHEGTHNCGKIGRLAQSRERFLLVARHTGKCPVFLYQPSEHPLRPCGDVLSTLPLPNDPSAGRLHRLPEISLRTWLRLAAIRPGKDWRDLSTLDGEERPAWARYRVTRWSDTMGAVAGSGTNSAWGVADVRVDGSWHHSVLGVVAASDPFGTITGNGRVYSGAFSFADARLSELPGRDWHHNVLRVTPTTEHTGTITGAGHPSAGLVCVADLAIGRAFRGAFGVASEEKPAATITGEAGASNGANAVADRRLRAPRPRYGMNWRVLNGGEPATCITGTRDVQAGAPSVADDRLADGTAVRFKGRLGMVGWGRPARTILGGPLNWAVGDVRLGADNPNRHRSKFYVSPSDAPARMVTGADRVRSGAPAYADLALRAPAYPRRYGVLDTWAPAEVITTNTAPGGGQGSVADLRLTCNPWKTSGVLGVLSLGQPSYTITSALDLWAGWAAVADPRVPSNPELAVRWFPRSLDAAPMFVPVFAGRGDGSWHRPLTLLERAALQGLPAVFRGAPLWLEGTLSQISEHIGNAVPVGAALAIAGEMLRTLILAATGAFALSSGSGVWVRRRPNGSFPLYVREQLRGASKRVRRRFHPVRAKVKAALAATVVGLVDSPREAVLQ